jgi:IS1 family transposase
LNVNLQEHQHHEFLDPRDHFQHFYEHSRRAIFDRRLRVSEKVCSTLQAHGVAGLFLDPEQTILVCAPRSHPGPRTDTAFHHTHLDEKLFATIARCLTEGVGVRATARITNVDKKTILRVLRRAAKHADKISRTLLQNLVVSECQLDEMWSFIGKKEAHLEPIEKLEGILGDAWIWIAFDSAHKIVLTHVIGKRTEPHAVSLLHRLKRLTARIPDLFTSDQLDQYTQALLKVYGNSVVPPRKPGPGRPPNPRLIPPKELLYAQVVKQYKGNRLVGITRKVVFGDPQKIQKVLQRSEVSQTINTSFVERNNATIRHMDARCTRKSYRFSKCRKNHERQFELCLTYYHLCQPHKALTKRYGRPATPFMSAGLTDHVWTMEELLGTRADMLGA